MQVATYNVKADIWSCGVIVYMLLVGFPPFSASGVYDLFRKIRACAYDFKDPAWELVSDEAKDFVTWLLTPDPEKRPSAEQALQHPWLQK